jgi:hypothetical protein
MVAQWLEDIGSAINQKEAFRSYAEQIFTQRTLQENTLRREDDPDVYEYVWNGYNILEKYMAMYNDNPLLSAFSMPWTSEIRILDPRH